MSHEPRECFITIVTGGQGLGKTKRTTDELEMYILNDVKANRKGRKVLIFDTNNEYGKYRTVAYNPDDQNDNGKFFAQLQNSDIRRVSPFLPNGQPMNVDQKYKCIKDILTQYRNGLVLFEDINTYVDKNATIDLTSGLVNVRHRSIDVIMHMQSLSRVSTIMWQNVGIIRMHHQNDPVDRYKARVTNFDVLKIAQIIVDRQYYTGNKYFFLYIDVQRDKIIGADRNQFISACVEYVTQYKNSEIRKKGGDKNTAIKAMVKEMDRFFQ